MPGLSLLRFLRYHASTVSGPFQVAKPLSLTYGSLGIMPPRVLAPSRLPSLSLLRFLVSEHCSIPGTTLGISFTDLRFHQGLTSFSNPCQANAWTCDRICQIFWIKCQCSGNSGVPSRTFGTVQKSKKQNFGYFRALFMECKFFALYFSIGRTKEIQHFTLASRRFYPFLMKSKRVKVDSKPDKPTEPQQEVLPGIPDGTELRDSMAKLQAPSSTS